MLYIQAEVRVKGRYRRVYLWRYDLWRESRSEARPFSDEAEAQATLERLIVESEHRPIRALKIVGADETTQPYRRRKRPSRHRWGVYREE